MSVSIEDVAKRANVSISTVSRVVNGRNIVNVNTRARVETAIRELGYRPNVFARGLMLKKSNLIGFVLPDLHGEFYSEIIRGANTKARELGYHLVLSSVMPHEDGKSVMAAVGNHGLVDGVAVMVSETDSHTLEVLDNLSMPLVILDAEVGDAMRHDSVMIDQRQGGMAMFRHLVQACRYERVIFVGGLATNIDTIQRLEAYRDVLSEANMAVDQESIYHLDYCYGTAFELAVQHVSEWADGKTSVFAANDEMAAGIIDAAIDIGIAVPNQLAVVGFDDTRVGLMTRPRLTTVRVPMSRMGESAVELLVQRLENPDRPFAKLTLKSELVIRESCGHALR